MAGARSGFHLRRDQSGFTVVETMVALGVILAAVMSLAFTASAGFSKLALARQRQDAAGLANQAMEQARALPFDTIKKGLGNTDLSGRGDPNITISGPDYLYGAEKIPHGDNSSVVPLVPHRSTATLGTATSYTVATYVTYYNNVTTSNIFRVTVAVSWNAKGTQGAQQVQTQSLFYSGSGCLSGATHPFAAPCQAFFFDSALVNPSHVTITGTLDGSDLGTATLELGDLTSDMQIEQIGAAQGTATTAGVLLTPAGGTTATVVGDTTITTGADNDPAQPDQQYGSATQLSELGGTLTAGSGQTTIDLAVGPGDSASTSSTTSASISPPYLCADMSGINQTDGQACGSGRNTQAAALSAVMSFSGSAHLAGPVNLVSVASSPTPMKVYTDRALASEVTICPTTSGDGCVHAEVNRSLATVSLVGLPSLLGVLPPGWTGYLLSLTGLGQTVTAEAGTGSAAPTVTQAGSLSYFGGAGYVPIPLSGLSGTTVTVPAIHLVNLIGVKVMTIDVSATITVGGGVVTDPAGCATPCTRTSASAQANSPLVATVLYTVTFDGATLAALSIGVDLGSLVAKATYQPAPSS
jgi:type II secretory pathway pseudopilin PulG